MTLSDLWKLLKGIGFAKIARSVSFLAWLILPFWIWRIVIQFVGDEMFVWNLALPGLALLLFFLFVMTAQGYLWKRHEFRIMKLVEKRASAAFSDPEDPEKAKEFKEECRKFILPYTYQLPFSLSGMAEAIRMSFMSVFINALVNLYMSYSFMTLLIVYQSEVRKLLVGLASIVYETLPFDLHFYVQWSIDNIWISLGVFWMLSLYYDPALFLVQKSGQIRIPKFRMVFLYLTTIPILAVRVTICVMRVLTIPILLAERARAVKVAPFVDPLTLREIVQRTIQNVEGRSCDVSRWSEKIETEADAERMRKDTIKDRSTPILLRILAKVSRPRDLLEKIKEMQPMTYIGVHNERCVFLGTVLYDPIQRIRRGEFYFDTTYLKNEFLLIYKGEVEKQRQMEMKLPSELEELIRRLG